MFSSKITTDDYKRFIAEIFSRADEVKIDENTGFAILPKDMQAQQKKLFQDYVKNYDNSAKGFSHGGFDYDKGQKTIDSEVVQNALLGAAFTNDFGSKRTGLGFAIDNHNSDIANILIDKATPEQLGSDSFYLNLAADKGLKSVISSLVEKSEPKQLLEPLEKVIKLREKLLKKNPRQETGLGTVIKKIASNLDEEQLRPFVEKSAIIKEQFNERFPESAVGNDKKSAIKMVDEPATPAPKYDIEKLEAGIALLSGSTQTSGPERANDKKRSL